MGIFWGQCCGIKLSSSMITASRRCQEFWLPTPQQGVQYTQPTGLWNIENKIKKIRKYSITQGSICNLCFPHICAHLWQSSRNAKKLRIDRGRQIVIEAPQLTYFHGFWQRGPCKARRCVCGLTSTYIFGFHQATNLFYCQK